MWGYEYCDIIESVHVGYCKRFLGVNNSVNNCMALGECGRMPLSVTYQTNVIKYWCKLIQMQESRYPKQCYEMLKSFDDIGRITWATKVKELLFKHGFGFVWISQTVGNMDIFIKLFRQRLIDCANQNWHDSVNSSSRCDFYKEFKSLLNTEKYLNVSLRKSLAGFRCSSHKFKIETGRHLNIHREERICIYCQQINNYRIIEIEHHVFFICPRYVDVRTQYLFTWYIHGNTPLDLYNLLQMSRTVKLLSIYIHHVLQIHGQDNNERRVI